MFCNMFSESSTGSWAKLQLLCCPSKQGELPKNMSQNLLHNLPPKTVECPFFSAKNYIWDDRTLHSESGHVCATIHSSMSCHSFVPLTPQRTVLHESITIFIVNTPQVFMLNEKRKLQPLLDVDSNGGDRDRRVTAVACLPVLETLGGNFGLSFSLRNHLCFGLRFPSLKSLDITQFSLLRDSVDFRLVCSKKFPEF